MDFALSDAHLAALVGGLGGVVLGLAARLGRFCTLGAIEDYLYGDNDHRLRMWGVAIGVAMVTTFALAGLGLVDLEAAPYLARGWNPAGHILGGLMFGVGMAMAGNCGFGALARLGGGDLRSFVIVLVMGISAYVVMSGPLAFLRVRIFPQDLFAGPDPAGIAHFFASLTGLPVAVWGLLAGIGLLVLTLRAPDFRAERKLIAWGGAVGLAVTFGWAGSTWLADISFDAVPVQSYTFAAPLGESILYAMTSSGMPITFAIGAVVGVWAGAFLGSLSLGHFRWEACEDPRELRRQIFGAMLMGAGAVLAMGCTIGQGLSAISVLSYGAPITMVCIFLGAAAGLRTMIAGFDPA